MKKLLLIFLFLLLLFILLFPVEVVELRVDNRVCLVPLSRLDVEVYYTHSVSHTKVWDRYKINGSGIYATEQRWQQFDAGQPLSYDKIENNFFVKNIEVKFDTLLEYGFISENNASVKVDGKIFEIKEKLELKLETVPLFMVVIERCS